MAPGKPTGKEWLTKRNVEFSCQEGGEIDAWQQSTGLWLPWKANFIPILQMRKVRPQDDKALGQSHIIVESGMCPRSASSKTRGSYQLAKSQWMYFGNNCLRICSKLHQFLLCRDALFSNPKVSLGRTLGSTVLASSQYSCLEKTMDRVAWRPTVHGVAKSRTQLSD